MASTNKLAVVFCALIFTGGAAAAGSEEARPQSATPPLSAAVDTFMRPYVESRNFSGAVLIKSGDETVVDTAYGRANWNHDVANTPRTRFQIGSISKTFTAASILLLAERGSLDLDDPVGKFLPEFPNGEAITIHHLLTHTSGLPRFVFQPDYVERSKKNHTATDLVVWVSELPPAAAPGERSGYSNANYAVLAAVVERVSGKDYRAFLETEIFTPLGLNDSGLARDARQIVPRLASGFQPVGRTGIEKARVHDYSSSIGSGAIYSTTHDLDRWYRSLRRGDLVNEKSLRLLFSRETGAETYAWRVTEHAGHEAVSAQGWDGVGFSGKLLHLEDENLTVIVLCNLNISSITSELVAKLTSIALGEDYETLELVTTPADSEALRKLAGLYRFGPDFYVPNTTIEFAEDKGELMVEGFQPGALLRVADGGFIHRQYWFRITFERDDTGRVTGIVYGNFKARRETDQ